MTIKKKIKIFILRSGLYSYLFTAINFKRKIAEHLSYLNLFFSAHANNKRTYKIYTSDVLPDILNFQVASICNANCIFCGYGTTLKEKKGFMNFVTFKKALDEYIALGGKKILFAPVYGDSLLDPGLGDKLEYVSKLKEIAQIGIITNGIALTKNNIYKSLIDNKINDIGISLADFDEKAYQEVYRVEAYKELMRGIENLLSYHAQQNSLTNITFHLRSPRQVRQIVESDDFIKYIKPYLGDHIDIQFMYSYDNWGGLIKKEDLRGLMKLRGIPKFRKMSCDKLFDFCVLFDGSVRLCACRTKGTQFDELIIGNIHTENLVGMLGKAASIRLKFMENDLPPVCRNCSFYTAGKKF